MTVCPYQYGNCDQQTRDNYCTCLDDANFRDKNGDVRACPFYKPRYAKHFCRDCIHYIFETETCLMLDRYKCKNDIMCAKYVGRK